MIRILSSIHLAVISKYARVVLPLAVTALAFGCSPQPVPLVTPTSIPAPSVTGAVTRAAPGTGTPGFVGGSIVIAGVGHPSRGVTTLPNFVSNALYDSLARVDPTDGSLKPGLAESWEVSDDSRTITFHLRAGVLWDDGQSLTAQDVVFTVKALSSPEVRINPAADFGPIADVLAADSRTVTVKLKQGYCPSLTSIGTLKVLPEHVLGTALAPTAAGTSQGASNPTASAEGEGQVDLNSLDPPKLVGSGPLVLRDWTADRITFTSNGSYWAGAPRISSWTYLIFNNVADAVAAVDSGQADVLSSEAGQIIGSESAADYRSYTRLSAQFYSLAMNNQNGILADARIRQAIAFSLDRAKLAGDIFGKDAKVLSTSVLPGFWVNPVNTSPPAFDPVRARQLLEDSGWSDSDKDMTLDKEGKPLQMTLYAVADDPVSEPLAFSIRSMLAQVGFRVLLQLDDRDEMLTRLFLHEFDLAVAPWGIPLDPDQHWYWDSTENIPGEGLNFVSYANPRVDELLRRGILASRCDYSARKAIYAQIYGMIAGDLPQVFLFAPPTTIRARLRVVGLAPSPFAGDYWNLNSWEVVR